jgi:hypothetical protein
VCDGVASPHRAGGSLLSVIDNGCLDVRVRLVLARDVAWGLTNLHCVGFVHKDVKVRELVDVRVCCCLRCGLCALLHTMLMCCARAICAFACCD